MWAASLMASTLPKMVKENRAIIRKYGSGNAPTKACCPGGKDQPHGRRPQSKQVQAIPWHESKLILDADGLVVPAGLLERWTDTPSWPKDFTTDRPWMYSMAAPERASWARWPTGAVRAPLPADAPQCKSGHQNTQERHQSRRRAKDGHAQQDHSHLDIAVDHRVHHLHALKFQRAQFRGEGGQDVPQVVPCEVPQGHPFQHIPQLQALVRRPTPCRYSPGAGSSNR